VFRLLVQDQISIELHILVIFRIIKKHIETPFSFTFTDLLQIDETINPWMPELNLYFPHVIMASVDYDH